MKGLYQSDHGFAFTSSTRRFPYAHLHHEKSSVCRTHTCAQYRHVYAIHSLKSQKSGPNSVCTGWCRQSISWMNLNIAIVVILIAVFAVPRHWSTYTHTQRTYISLSGRISLKTVAVHEFKSKAKTTENFKRILQRKRIGLTWLLFFLSQKE